MPISSWWWRVKAQGVASRWWIAGALGACVCTPALGQAGPDTGRPDLALVGSLPDSVDMVVAVRDLAAVRDGPCGRALEGFLRQMSDWGRSAAAWEDFGHALGMTPDDAVDSLIGSGVVLAGTGMDPRHNRPAQFAVLSTVTPQTEALLRSRLRPAPRGIIENLPVLSLEKGAYQLAISVPRRASAGDVNARLLVAPEGSSDLFDELIP